MKKSFLKFLFISLSLAFPQLGYSAVKQLYLDSIASAPELTRVPQTVDTRSQKKLKAGDSEALDQLLAFQSAFTILAGNIDIDIAIERDNKGDLNRTIKVELFKVSGGTQILIGSDADTFDIPTNGPGGSGIAMHSFQLNTTGVSFVLADFIRLVITHEPSPGTKETVRVHTYHNNIPSQIIMQTNTIINVDNIEVYGNPAPAVTPLFISYTQGSTVYIRPTVSDPFGFADIRTVDVNVYDTAGNPDLQVAGLTALTSPAAAGAVAYFETPYTIPNVDGIYIFEVIAYEGSENTVRHTLRKKFHVGIPSLYVSKSSATVYDPVNLNTSPKAIPGSQIKYTVKTTNSGFGFVDNNSVIISDPLPGAQATFYFGVPVAPVQFIDGAVSSGLSYNFIDLSSTIDDVQFSNDGCTTFVLNPTADPVTGYDTTSPKINCIEINPKGDFNGSDGINNPAFSVTFIIKVD